MKSRISLLFIAATLALPGLLGAQPQPPPGPPPRLSPKDAAPEDITGNWVAVVTEDWRWRMQTPAKGDFTSIPLNPEGRKTAEAWDPAKDEAAGNQCKAYGAPGLMRLPTRLRISWQDENTLKVETDEGTQTRLFHFNGKVPAGQAPSLQGYSVAEWDISRPTFLGFNPPPSATKLPGSLKVETTNLRPGYLRKNGIPYSASASMTEYWDLNLETNGEQWIVVTTVVNDPVYLQEEWITDLHFKKEPDGSKWDPAPCSARW